MSAYIWLVLCQERCGFRIIQKQENGYSLQVRAELMVPAAAAVAALQQNKDPEAAAQAAEAEAQAAAVPEKLDEFGRDENAVRRDRAGARSKARAAALADLKGRFESSPAALLCDSEALAAAACGGGFHGTQGGEATAEKTAYYAKRLGELQVLFLRLSLHLSLVVFVVMLARRFSSF